MDFLPDVLQDKQAGRPAGRFLFSWSFDFPQTYLLPSQAQSHEVGKGILFASAIIAHIFQAMLCVADFLFGCRVSTPFHHFRQSRAITRRSGRAMTPETFRFEIEVVAELLQHR